MAPKYPGMVPYLEQAYLWHSFHTALNVHLSDVLNAVLPAGYIARVEQRLAILLEDQMRVADVALIEAQPARTASEKTGAAVMERGAPDGVVSALTSQVYERYIEIRTGSRLDRRIVTVIELLSPSNKAVGSRGRSEYLQKQEELLHSNSNLMEIDLLSFGAHTVAAPLQRLPDKRTWDYIVSLHKWTDRYHFAYWLNRLSEPLPEIRVPLMPEDGDVVVDLQAVFADVYRAGRFADEIDLTAPLPDSPWS